MRGNLEVLLRANRLGTVCSRLHATRNHSMKTRQSMREQVQPTHIRSIQPDVTGVYGVGVVVAGLAVLPDHCASVRFQPPPRA